MVSRRRHFINIPETSSIYKCPADHYVSAQQRAAGIQIASALLLDERVHRRQQTPGRILPLVQALDPDHNNYSRLIANF